ncbi:NHL repeat-containing protein 2-like protein [Leptotrombidium deliense]|uniref:NHL repeat-containing protein 2-like protein n=1 Tax=Leptotrombidium deliense TaxID=299467 RepID=A0A443SCB3_9ACAR|nr:NHL repeat-containing protein 2-like protein [Leptotrombidium deliense]
MYNNRYFVDVEWVDCEAKSCPLNTSDCIVVVDFFTYCCINCLHILPILKEIENEFCEKKAFVVIGVHSAKFQNEKVSSHIKQAIEKYNITHPVINDANCQLWSAMSISCWPTVLILGPGNRVFFYLIGENNISKWLRLYCNVLYNFYEQKGHFSSKSFSVLAVKNFIDKKRNLRFPAKISLSPNQCFIAISDSGNNRILIVDLSGKVIHVIGSSEAALKDDHFSKAAFNQPQGVAWLSEDILFVADTNNHCIRKIIVSQERVETIASNHSCNGGESEEMCKIVSPWDLCVVDKNKVFIAMAGSHQICVLCLTEKCDVFDKLFSSGQCHTFAGSGREENRNNRYPLKAAFAQPSGIVYSEQHTSLFVADSESSTIRRVYLKTGSVENVVGGSRDPLDLFAFGDKDAKAFDVRLQHPLGIAISPYDDSLFVADSYNHKIKQIDLKTRDCITMAGTGISGNNCNCSPLQASFNEPNGICVLEKENILLVCDTNNHCIKKIDLIENHVSLFDVLFEKKAHIADNFDNDVIELMTRRVSHRSEIAFEIDLKFAENVHQTDDMQHIVRLSISGQ